MLNVRPKPDWPTRRVNTSISLGRSSAGETAMNTSAGSVGGRRRESETCENRCSVVIPRSHGRFYGRTKQGRGVPVSRALQPTTFFRPRSQLESASGHHALGPGIARPPGRHVRGRCRATLAACGGRLPVGDGVRWQRPDRRHLTVRWRPRGPAGWQRRRGGSLAASALEPADGRARCSQPRPGLVLGATFGVVAAPAACLVGARCGLLSLAARVVMAACSARRAQGAISAGDSSASSGADQ